MKKTRKRKFVKLPKFDAVKWDTTDEEEIERRRLRAQSEKFKIDNINPDQRYFSIFSVRSKSGNPYRVEIRSLIDTINSCDCPDYQSNQLGSCKHIEAVLFRLQKLGKKLFKKISLIGSEKIEIFFDTRINVLRVQWPLKINQLAKDAINSFFSEDRTLIGNPVSTYSTLENLQLINKKIMQKSVRLSSHIKYYIDYQKQLAQRASAKDIFLRDVAAKKRTLAVVNQPLYPYQQEGMVHLAFNERALLADEMGLGKTVQAIAACELLRQNKNVHRVLVIATASLKAEWEEQIAKFTALNTLIIQGTRANRLLQYQKKAFFYLMNYEQVMIDHSDIQRLISPDVIILDEAQRIKNWQTKTANAVKTLKSRYAFVLTGTPLENRIDDIYSIIQFLDPHVFGSLFRFNRDFYAIDEKGKPIGYKNLDLLHQRVRTLMLRRLKSDVEGQLPQRTVNNYFVKMDPEQRVRYEEFEAKLARLMNIIRSRPLRKEEMERLQRYLACMRMLCDTTYILDDQSKISPKVIELNAILDELLSDQTAKIIIFSEWERMLKLVRESAQKKEIDFAWHTGSVVQHKRRDDINRFKKDPHCRLFLSTDSGSVGLNLQSANIVINLDLPWNPAKLEQRIARAWRKHQTRAVRVINLVCEDSIEHRMLSLLVQKQTLAQGVLEGKDDLKEMKLPSGRAALLERLENLMGETHDVPTIEKQKINAKWHDDIDLLQSHSHSETNTRSILAVTDKPSVERQKQLHKFFKDEAVTLEMIDRQTFELLQRLEKAGILTLNQPAEIFQASEAFSELHKKIKEDQINHAKKHFSYAVRKHKMADVLLQSNFDEEALEPLRDALQSTVYAFSCLVGKKESEIENQLSHDFIQEKLVNAYGFPSNAASLFLRIHENTNALLVKDWMIEQKLLIEHVENKFNEIANQ